MPDYKIKVIAKDYSVIGEENIIEKPERFSVDKIIDILSDFFKNRSEEIQNLISTLEIRKKGDTKEIFDYQESRILGIAGVIQKKGYKYNDEIYDISIEIRSRFDHEKPYLLTTMLEAAVDSIKFAEDTVPTSIEQLFEFLLVNLYKEKLLKTSHMGLFKTYQYFEENNSNIKGTIDISRHIRENAGLKNGLIAYRYREHTVDNSFNHFLLHTFLLLKRAFPEHVGRVINSSPEAMEVINQLMMNAPGYQKTDIRSLRFKNDKPIVQPYFQPYEEFRKVCVRINDHLGISIFEGEESEVQGMLFYVPDLWEAYLNERLSSLLEKKAYKNKIHLEFQKEINTAEGRLVARPDFVFTFQKENEEKTTPFMILDAKYRNRLLKLLDGDKFSSYNFTADFDKCIRDMTITCSHAAGVAFPVNESKEDEWKKIKQNLSQWEKVVKQGIKISDFNSDKFYAFPVCIPDDDKNYDEWKKNLYDGDHVEEYLKVVYTIYKEGMDLTNEGKEVDKICSL